MIQNQLAGNLSSLQGIPLASVWEMWVVNLSPPPKFRRTLCANHSRRYAKFIPRSTKIRKPNIHMFHLAACQAPELFTKDGWFLLDKIFPIWNINEFHQRTRKYYGSLPDDIFEAILMCARDFIDSQDSDRDVP
ncbi:MAG: hypothetical protein ABSD46_02990 [Bacteroidota bacterium]